MSLFAGLLLTLSPLDIRMLPEYATYMGLETLDEGSKDEVNFKPKESNSGHGGGAETLDEETPGSIETRGRKTVLTVEEQRQRAREAKARWKARNR